MTTQGRPHIVVGVDGSEAALVAVRWAAAEAVRSGAEIVIVHAGPGMPALAARPLGFYPLTPAEYRGIGTRIVNQARKVARGVTGSTWSIRTTVVDSDSTAAAVTEQALGSVMLVIGDERRSLVDRLVTGSIVHGVAGRARVPVVVVPETWRAEDPTGVVVVGVGDAADTDDLLGHAMQVAQDRGAMVRVVHARDLPAMYDNAILARVDDARWRRRNLQQIQGLVGRLASAHPHVKVDISLVPGQPARALVAASQQADLLVLGRHRHGLRHLGATARAVLREAGCPVEVLPPAAERVRPVRPQVLDPELVG